MKKLVSMLLVLCVVGTGTCMAADSKAAETPTVISMDNIEQIWTEKSQDLVKYKSDLALARDSYKNLADHTDDMTDAPLGSIDMSTYNSLWNSRDQAELSYQIVREQYQQNIQNAQLAAKKSFLACWQDEISVNAAQQSLAIQQDQLKGYGVLLEQGYLSKFQYNNIKTSVESLRENLESIKIQQETDQILLKSTLGLHPESDVALVYPELSKESLAQLMEINYSTDLEAYRNNSVNIKVLQLTYNSKKSRAYASYAQGQNAKVELEAAQANLPNGFKVAYNNLTMQYGDLKNSYHNLLQEEDTHQKLQTKYLLGVSSFMDYTNAELSYLSAEAQVKGKEISLYDTYLTYLNMVAGN